MVSGSMIRTIPMLLFFVSAVFAVAPGWVAKGAVLDYSMDEDTVTFTVTERTSKEVRMEIDAEGKYKATENASLTYGQFWFDNKLLEDASKGDVIEEFRVTGTGSQTFAGKQWDAVMLEATLSGARTERTYDRESGLMLKQTVYANGAPKIVLSKFKVPDFDAAAPVSQPTATSPTTVSKNTTAPNPTETVPTGSEQPDPSAQPYSNDVTPDPEDKTCAVGAVLLGLLGFAFLRR